MQTRHLLLALAIAAGGPMSALAQQDMGRRSTVYAPRNAAATSQPLATAAALEIMQQGGNAIDGAVAAAAVLNVTEPHMTGMGGDAFSIVWLADTRKLIGIDASGRSGSGMSVEALRARGHDRVPGSGPEAVTVPGAVSGWNALVTRYGNLTLAEVLQPAIRIAREGFPVTPVIARQWAGATEKLARDEGARATYLVDGERAPRAGEWQRVSGEGLRGVPSSRADAPGSPSGDVPEVRRGGRGELRRGSVPRRNRSTGPRTRSR